MASKLWPMIFVCIVYLLEFVPESISFSLPSVMLTFLS